MRTIKFRAWNKLDNKMYYNVQNAYDSMCCHCKKGCEDLTDGSECERWMHERSFGDVLKAKHLVVMEFTGEFDKNGIELYEGDIIKASCPNPFTRGIYRFQIIFESGSYICSP